MYRPVQFHVLPTFNITKVVSSAHAHFEIGHCKCEVSLARTVVMNLYPIKYFLITFCILFTSDT